VLKDQLGHEDIETTLGIYSHASEPSTRAADAVLVENYALSDAKALVM
jgi:integrase